MAGVELKDHMGWHFKIVTFARSGCINGVVYKKMYGHFAGTKKVAV